MTRKIITLPRLRATHPVLTVDQLRVIKRERLTQTERALAGACVLLSIPVPATALTLVVALLTGLVF